jgi:hypothetical protein
MSEDYQRGVVDERARIRKYISTNAAYFAAQAGVSIDMMESWDGTDETLITLKGKNKKIRFAALLVAYALTGLLRWIDADDQEPASPQMRPSDPMSDFPKKQRKRR